MLHHKTFKIKSMVVVCSIPSLALIVKKNTSYDLKFLSFKFGKYYFITFEMPRVSYKRPVGKMKISLLFCPPVIRGPYLNPVDIGEGNPLLLKEKICIPLTIPVPPTYLPRLVNVVK